MGVEHTAAITAGTFGPMACRAAKETTALNGKAINSRTAVVMVMSHNVLDEPRLRLRRVAKGLHERTLQMLRWTSETHGVASIAQRFVQGSWHLTLRLRRGAFAASELSDVLCGTLEER